MSSTKGKYKPGTANVDGPRPDFLTPILAGDTLVIRILFLVIKIAVSQFILPQQMTNERNILVPAVSVL